VRLRPLYVRLRTQIAGSAVDSASASREWTDVSRSHTNQASGLGLRHIALLEGLSDAALEALARRCAWRSLAPDQTVISRDADDRNVYFIVSGRVRATMYSHAGRQVTFRDQVAGEFLGELSAIDGEPRQHHSRTGDAPAVCAYEDRLAFEGWQGARRGRRRAPRTDGQGSAFHRLRRRAIEDVAQAVIRTAAANELGVHRRTVVAVQQARQ
jgi:CRP-like cAMP-binding protein